MAIQLLRSSETALISQMKSVIILQAIRVIVSVKNISNFYRLSADIGCRDD